MKLVLAARVARPADDLRGAVPAQLGQHGVDRRGERRRAVAHDRDGVGTSRPCCAFHAHSSMRISRASGQPGLLLVGGATSTTFGALGGALGGAEPTLGMSARGGTDGAAFDALPPNMSGRKCRAAIPALAS